MSSKPTQRLMVTGARGFVGGHVSQAVHRGEFGEVELVEPPKGWDVRDQVAVADFVAEVRPDQIVHLAAQSFVPRSFEAPRETYETNCIGTLNLLQALKETGFSGRLLYVSSGDIYGRVPEEQLPVDETRWPEPRSPYAVSKMAAEQLCLQSHRSDGLDVLIARPFNHVGPGQSAQFVLPALANQIVAIADGRQVPVIDVGDIDSTRDFTDVRDVVAAYAAMLTRGRPGETYVVGSGLERRIRDLLRTMCDIEDVTVEIRQNPAKMRPSEQRRMVADASKVHRDTGWAPRVPIETTLMDILKDARGHHG